MTLWVTGDLDWVTVAESGATTAEISPPLFLFEERKGEEIEGKFSSSVAQSAATTPPVRSESRMTRGGGLGHLLPLSLSS
ncbi:hypothetical protein CRG98_017658 [Punica granatum]|uniref:Uncharacterized protein n=1 Tax=Punica granatum TaxID=22663 RepID=A0A2I0K073_PUNGR|nr:hypothetical protein CRG98_017658 [Punica granatum]